MSVFGNVRPLRPDGGLQAAALVVLEAVSRVPAAQLAACRVARRSDHWLRVPWYRKARGGGAIALGRTIHFTGNWFSAEGPHARGDGSLCSTWHWLSHLAHEVGHLPQADAFGHHRAGRLRYVLAFAGQYAWRALTLKGDVHDGATLERQADRGRWVLHRLVGASPLTHPLVTAVQANDAQAARAWIEAHAAELRAAHAAYPW
ncbi:MAG: hypothetical protein JNL05_13230 [Flavobacteriales bacterium]|nr:hypothetical protein [Flavobacteriales bacterium]